MGYSWRCLFLALHLGLTPQPCPGLRPEPTAVPCITPGPLSCPCNDSVTESGSLGSDLPDGGDFITLGRTPFADLISIPINAPALPGPAAGFLRSRFSQESEAFTAVQISVFNLKSQQASCVLQGTLPKSQLRITVFPLVFQQKPSGVWPGTWLSS